MSDKLTDSERRIVNACLFQPHYSGEDSRKFWDEVAHSANDRVLFDFACALQDIEARVLAALNQGVATRAEKVVRRHRAQRRARK